MVFGRLAMIEFDDCRIGNRRTISLPKVGLLGRLHA